LPVVITTTADENGNWTYELDSGLSEGSHEAYVAVSDDTGRIVEKSGAMSFVVGEVQAQTPDEYFKSLPAVGIPSAEAPVTRAYGWYIVGAAGAMLLGIILGAVLVLRRLKPPLD
jgi:hypothetical protein